MSCSAYKYYLHRKNRHDQLEVIGIIFETEAEIKGIVLYSEVVPGDVGTLWQNLKRNIAKRWETYYDASMMPPDVRNLISSTHLQ